MPSATAWEGGDLAYQKLIDITFHFLEANRVQGDSDTGVPYNMNFVKGGHNLQPFWKTRKFHYGGVRASKAIVDAKILAPATEADGKTPIVIPAFYSFPLEVLFTDPDVYPGEP
jgi:hypothetical protein